jgi:hypothetical protein
MDTAAAPPSGTRRRTAWLVALGVVVVLIAVAAGVLASPGGHRDELVLYVQVPDPNPFIVGVRHHTQVAAPAWTTGCDAPTFETGTVVTQGVASVPPLQAPTWQQIVCPVPSLPSATFAPLGRIPGTYLNISAVQGVANGSVLYTAGCVTEEIVAEGPSRDSLPCLGVGSAS